MRKAKYVTACGSNEIKKLIEKRNKRKELKYKAAPTKNFFRELKKNLFSP